MAQMSEKAPVLNKYSLRRARAEATWMLEEIEKGNKGIPATSEDYDTAHTVIRMSRKHNPDYYKRRMTLIDSQLTLSAHLGNNPERASLLLDELNHEYGLTVYQWGIVQKVTRAIAGNNGYEMDIGIPDSAYLGAAIATLSARPANKDITSKIKGDLFSLKTLLLSQE